MIGYTCVGTNQLERAVAFYDDLLGLLGAKPFFKSDRGVGWGVSPDQPMFSVLQPFDGQAATVGNGCMVALAARDPEQVQALHARALALGGSDEGAPGPRGAGFYGAYFRDLDGNKLAAFCMIPAPN
jgi:catechol 2,3-dioxygenase-like lactoylglutathione lyase family enzyme